MGKELTLIMDNGDAHIIIGETSVYWLCNGCRFRKANKHILEVRELAKPEEAAKQPKKRKPPSKSKSTKRKTGANQNPEPKSYES